MVFLFQGFGGFFATLVNGFSGRFLVGENPKFPPPVGVFRGGRLRALL